MASAHSPASREVGSGAVKIASRKAQTEQCFFHVLVEVGHVDGIEFFAEGCHLFNYFHVFLAFVIGAGGKFIVQAIDFCLHFKQVRECLRGFLENGAAVLGEQMLREIGDYSVLWI